MTHLRLYTSKFQYLIYSNSESFFLACWYIQLIHCNVNWILSSCVKSVCQFYTIFLFIKFFPSTSNLRNWAPLIIMFLLLHILYIWLAYFIDYQKKTNFITTASLGNVRLLKLYLFQQKRNLEEILAIFDDNIIVTKDGAKANST